MEFQELTKKEYQNYWENHPLKSFLSSVEFGELKEKYNWKSYFVGVKKNKQIIVAAMLLSHKRDLNQYEFYSPKGFLMNYQDQKLLEFFIEELRKYIKDKKGYILRIEPYLTYKENDNNVNIVVDKLLELGFNKVKSTWMHVINLEGKKEQEILKELKQTARNKIKEAEKSGVVIKEINENELDLFYDIMKGQFPKKTLLYYQNMYQTFHKKEEIKFLITEKQSDNTILSGSIFILKKPEVICFSNRYYKEYLKYNPQYLIHWELIKYGLENGYKKYIAYRLPKDFNSYTEELIGEFELPINRYYNIIKLINILKGGKKNA